MPASASSRATKASSRSLAPTISSSDYLFLLLSFILTLLPSFTGVSLLAYYFLFHTLPFYIRTYLLHTLLFRLCQPCLIPVTMLYPHTTVLFIDLLCVPLISVSLLAPTASLGFQQPFMYQHLGITLPSLQVLTHPSPLSCWKFRCQFEEVQPAECTCQARCNLLGE